MNNYIVQYWCEVKEMWLADECFDTLTEAYSYAKEAAKDTGLHHMVVSATVLVLDVTDNHDDWENAVEAAEFDLKTWSFSSL